MKSNSKLSQEIENHLLGIDFPVIYLQHLLACMDVNRADKQKAMPFIHKPTSWIHSHTSVLHIHHLNRAMRGTARAIHTAALPTRVIVRFDLAF
jgi:hypothetical protein